jgi:HEAT repeat protein
VKRASLLSYAAYVLLGLALSACNDKSQPLLSHGQPVSHWLEELKSSDPAARKKAITALGHLGKADPAAIPALIEALHDNNAVVRDAAVLALLNLGPDAKDAVPALTNATKDKDANVRAHAAKAVERIQGK